MNLRCILQVAVVPEDIGTSGALRAVVDHLTASDILVVSGDLVTDVPPGVVAATHRRHGAVVTALLCDTPISGISETGSKDKAKKLGQYNIVGLDPTRQFFLLIASVNQEGQNWWAVYPMHGLIEIKYTSILHSEPFVLAAQAAQVYYSNYPSTMKEQQYWWAVFKTKGRSTFNLSPIENDDENVNDLHRGVYQEDDTSFPRLIAPSEELDNPAVLVDNEFEEVNPSRLVEDDGDDGSEEENEYDDDSDEANETEDDLQHEEHEFASSDDD